MASLLDVGNCDINSLLNTGIPYCDIKKNRLYGYIFLDDGLTVPESAMASQAAFLTWLQTAAQAPRGSRAYPMIGVFNNFEDQTGDPNKAGVGNLTTKQIIIDDAIPTLSAAHSKGELLHKKLIQLEVGSYDVLLVDKSFQIYGTRTATNELGGYSIYQAYVYPGKFLGTDAVNQYRFDITLDSFQEYRNNSAVFSASAAIGNVTGLNNVVETLFNQTTNVAKVKFMADGNKNLFDLPSIKTALTTAGSIIATNKQTGASFTITSVVATDTANKVFTVTLDSTAYTALVSGDKVTIDLAAPSVLKVNGIVGFESLGGVDVTKA